MKRDYKVRQHGTYEGFKHGCDCDDCYRAYTKVRDARADQTVKEGKGFTGRGKGYTTVPILANLKHGASSAGSKGCPCELCREWQKAKYRRLRDARGGRSREQYLADRRANPKHGRNRYKTHGCRCAICVDDYRKWYDENKDVLQERMARYRAGTLEIARANSRRYYQEHKKEINAKSRARYAERKALANGPVGI